jgi:alanyl-tRNA synthetase
MVDHIKAATWIIADGVKPGRNQREYIVRRLIRRAIRHAKNIGVEELFTAQLGELVIQQFSIVHPNLEKNSEEILEALDKEEKKFNQTIKKGLSEVEELAQKHPESFDNAEGESFTIYETYGFPPEMLLEEFKNRDIEVDEEQFWNEHEKAFKQHQEQSRSASKGMFKGGLADTSEKSTHLHTATHLLLAALYEVVGDHVYQKGSNITPERLRFDFPNDKKLTDEQLQKVEDVVNQKIHEDLPISWDEYPKEKALEMVKYASFEDRYGDVVKVYTIGDEEPYSVEICNGPHAERTGELGEFKITKHKSVGAGVKRIKAVLE